VTKRATTDSVHVTGVRYRLSRENPAGCALCQDVVWSSTTWHSGVTTSAVYKPGSLRLIASSATTSMKSALPHRVDEKSKASGNKGKNRQGALLSRYNSHNRSINRDLRTTDYIILDTLLIGFRNVSARRHKSHKYFNSGKFIRICFAFYVSLKLRAYIDDR